MVLEESVKFITTWLGSLIEGLAAAIIAFAVLKALLLYVRGTVIKKIDALEVRLGLGKALALSLEFLLAADILRTAVSPNWDDIGKLAAIAALRTMLNFFLERELKHTAH